MYYRIMAVIFAFFLLSILFFANTWQTSAKDIVIWYLPHPDDETLGMADSIYQSVLDGNYNYFIYFSKGSTSITRLTLTGPDGKIHQLTQEEFGRARVKETLAALQVLGISPDQVIFFDYQDGNIPQTAVEETIRFFAKLFPGSLHCTVNSEDRHKDHQTLARALANVAQEEGLDIYSKYYHVYIDQNFIPSEKTVKKPVLYPDKRKQALAEFTKWAPDNLRYAIARSSTPNLFNVVLNSKYEYFDRDYTGAPPDKLSIRADALFSNLGLGCFIHIADRFALNGFYEFNSSAALVGVGLNFNDIIPSLDLNWTVGYNYNQQQLYTMITATAVSYFTFKALHTYGNKTMFGIGLSVPLFQ